MMNSVAVFIVIFLVAGSFCQRTVDPLRKQRGTLAISQNGGRTTIPHGSPFTMAEVQEYGWRREYKMGIIHEKMTLNV